MVTLMEARPLRPALLVMAEKRHTDYVRWLKDRKGSKSLRSFSEELGVSANTISGHLDGDAPKVPTLIRIADATGTPRMELVFKAYPELEAESPPTVRDELAAMLAELNEESLRDTAGSLAIVQRLLQRLLGRSADE